jgi:hypothetical protein
MWLGFACCDELIADSLRKWDIHQSVTVDVPNFAFADTIFYPAEAMRMCFGVVPG